MQLSSTVFGAGLAQKWRRRHYRPISVIWDLLVERLPILRGSTIRMKENGIPRTLKETAGRMSLRRRFLMIKFAGISRRLLLVLGISFGLWGIADGHSGFLDGYGCHIGPDKVSYHCHEGQFTGRTFKSKADFLRELRGGKSEQLLPKNNPLPLTKKPDK